VHGLLFKFFIFKENFIVQYDEFIDNNDELKLLCERVDISQLDQFHLH
jgi:hypothetical protein